MVCLHWPGRTADAIECAKHHESRITNTLTKLCNMCKYRPYRLLVKTNFFIIAAIEILLITKYPLNIWQTLYEYIVKMRDQIKLNCDLWKLSDALSYVTSSDRNSRKTDQSKFLLPDKVALQKCPTASNKYFVLDVHIRHRKVLTHASRHLVRCFWKVFHWEKTVHLPF